MITYTTFLEAYSLEQLLELDNKLPEDTLEYLVETGYLSLPKIKPLDFE